MWLNARSSKINGLHQMEIELHDLKTPLISRSLKKAQTGHELTTLYIETLITLGNHAGTLNRERNSKKA